MTITDTLFFLYLLALSLLSLYGMLGLFTLWLYRRHRHEAFPPPPYAAGQLPPVTVQLPLYNEKHVVERLIGAAASLNYPAERLQIQVVDDSTDETTARAAALVSGYRAAGVDIDLLHREEREGYKAGALGAALAQASGDYIAIFDADFRPDADFLMRTIPHFLQQPDLGMIQARWGHLNAADSPLTGAQALALDKHFVIEQTVRHRADLFPKFNGTAGIWRRACVEDAGGWETDTVCEDLCLSTRAQLRGWRFRFLPDVVAPAELPNSISAYKNQQARWAKGSTQCLLKFGQSILSSRRHSLRGRLYAVLTMGAYATSLLLLVLLLLQLPLLYLDYRFPPGMLAFSIAGLGQPLLFLTSQQVLYPRWWRRLPLLGALLLTAIGMSVTISRAVVQAFARGEHVFIRTPKQGEGSGGGYRLPFDRGTFLEGFFALYAAAGLLLALYRANYGPALFLASCVLGFGGVALLSLRERFAGA